MEKTGVVASLGQLQLLRPAWTKAALAANDRLKLYLTVLQAAETHAAHPSRAPLRLKQELAAAGNDAGWLSDLPATAYLEGSDLHIPDLGHLLGKLTDDIQVMARPMEGDAEAAHKALLLRAAEWQAWLGAQKGDALTPAQIKALTSGDRHGEDSFHILVMDLHKALNKLAESFATETIDGAHAWQLGAADRPLVQAFMRGLNRTRPLKLDHPGLDTAATRDGDKLLIQNDIGTNDAHVLVVQVEEGAVVLTYSDLHRQRFAFFQKQLAEIGAVWSGITSQATAGLNEGAAYHLGTARFACPDETALGEALHALGSRIVYLIDWNRARKRLGLFVGKSDAIAVLTEAARREAGHMGWLAAGGETLIQGAMQALGGDYFRIGERLDQALGKEPARDFLIEVLVLASHAMRQHQPLPMIADAVRLLLLRSCRRHRDAFDLLAEHAAYCHALAEGLRDAIAHGHEHDAKAAGKFAERAKNWERQADLQVIRARDLAASRPSGLPFLRLIEQADDIADALEEAAFLLSLIAETARKPWHGAVQEPVRKLADAALAATQDYVRALAVARGLGGEAGAEDQEEFLAAAWRVVNAERQCDTLLRDVRRALARHTDDAAGHMLSTDFASALEQATDALLVTTYVLRDLAFSRIGAKP